MSQPSCFGSVEVCTARLAKLDTNGVPLPGAGNLYVTNQVIELTISAEVIEGTDFEQLNGCGDVVIALKKRDRIKRFNLSMQLSYPDVEITQMLIGGDLITSGGQSLGYLFPEIGLQADLAGVSLEFWTTRAGSGGQAEDYAYWRWILPKTKWQIGDRTAGNDIMITNFTGFGEENTNWYNGPANDFPYASNRVMAYVMTNSIPTTTCGATTLAAS